MCASKLTRSPGAGSAACTAGVWPASGSAGAGGPPGPQSQVGTGPGSPSAGRGGARGGPSREEGGGGADPGGGGGQPGRQERRLVRGHVGEHRGEQRVGRDVLFVQEPGGPGERASPPAYS